MDIELGSSYKPFLGLVCGYVHRYSVLYLKKDSLPFRQQA